MTATGVGRERETDRQKQRQRMTVRRTEAERDTLPETNDIHALEIWQSLENFCQLTSKTEKNWSRRYSENHLLRAKKQYYKISTDYTASIS